jgi:hypothetical protein
MVLHLLSKKSWNVYAPDNIARVKRDQAEAQAREREEDRRLQEHDSDRRLAVLRGELSITLPEQEARADDKSCRREEHGHKDDRRKRRRLHGEDDTDRDLRLTQEDMELRHERRNHEPRRDDKRRWSDAPITDQDGHINLFPVDHKVSATEHKNAEVEAEKARKKRELEDQYTMRFSNAVGRNGQQQGPWYATSRKREREDMVFVDGKDFWGRPDPSAKDREERRQMSNDPFAFMQKAQSQLKQAKKDKIQWQVQEQGKVIKPERHREKHGSERSRDRDIMHAGEDMRRHKDRLAEGDNERRRRSRVYEDNKRRSRHASPSRKMKNRRGIIPEVLDGFQLDD